MASRWFTRAVLLFFVFEALWFVFSAAYPMAFDEDFHLGVIRIYAEQWLPFLHGQPGSAEKFGALAADPSYLYHYGMSFPYRFVQAFTDSQTTAVIVLRLINVALAAAAVWLFGSVLRRAGISRALANITLALFVLVPVVPQLAGQINYDNAMLLLLALLLLRAFDVYEAARRRQLHIPALLWLVGICMVGSLVKYAFLPFAAVVALFAVGVILRAFKGHYALLRPAATISWRAAPRGARVLLIAGLLVASVLFIQRFGVNVVRYHTPVPSCDAVLGVNGCLGYGPWVRNYALEAAKPEDANDSALYYTSVWLQSLHYRMFFAVNGPSDSYRNYPPLPLPSGAFVVLAVVSVLALAAYGYSALRNRPLVLLLLGMSLFYIAVLWAEDYSQFVETGQPVAINGRYILPVLLPLAAACGLALKAALWDSLRLKTVAACIVLLAFAHGGGVFTFILRSDAAWYWSNATVRAVNENTQRVLLPVTFTGNKYYW